MAQPYSGYAVTADAGSENTIIAILIKRNGSCCIPAFLSSARHK
ncbi:hypothetical protein AAK706_07090 [Erysipelotrichaceae bacterium 66-17]